MNEKTELSVAPSDTKIKDAFTWWSNLRDSAAAKTTLEDWSTKLYRDAVVFYPHGQTDDVFMVRGQSVINFGIQHYTLEEAYRLIAPPPPPPRLDALRTFRSMIRSS